MWIQLVKSPAIGAAERHTIENMLDRLGYFYQWRDETQLNASVLTLLYHSQFKPLTEAIFYIPQYKRLSALSADELWHETDFEGKTLPVLGRRSLQLPRNHSASGFEFDLIANVYYHLFRVEEKAVNHPDEMDREISDSVLYKYGQFTIPVVDYFYRWFQKRLEESAQKNNRILVRKAVYPSGEPFGIALTHDVDFIRAYHPLKKFLKKLTASLSQNRNASRSIEEKDKAYWAFHRILPFYEERNIRATFFFLARYSENGHFRYRIRSGRLRRLFRQLKETGHEIGLHPSRYAFEHPRRYFREKRKLQNVTDCPIAGMRHHYLRGTFPQIWRIAQSLQLSYDATMVYRDFSGFRAGVSHPYPTFDHETQESYDVYECPTLFFEHTLPQKGTDRDGAVNVLGQILEEVKAAGGLMNVLWHSGAMFRPPFAETWNALLETLRKQSAFWAPLQEQVQWLRQRKSISLLHLQQDGRRSHLTLHLPSHPERLALDACGRSCSMSATTPGIDIHKTNDCFVIENKTYASEIHVTVEDHG